MRDINIFGTDMFPYLEGEEIKGSTITLTIRDLRQEEMITHKGKREPKEVLYFSETKKGFVLNKTNAKRIAQMYGPQTGQWQGKQITLTTEEVQAFGELHNALRVVPGVIHSAPEAMSLDMLLGKLNKVKGMQGFYKTPRSILSCRAKGAVLPVPDDIDGWRNLFIDARDYALGEIARAVDEGEPEILDEVAAEVDAELEAEYPEIFREQQPLVDLPADDAPAGYYAE